MASSTIGNQTTPRDHGSDPGKVVRTTSIISSVSSTSTVDSARTAVTTSTRTPTLTLPGHSKADVFDIEHVLVEDDPRAWSTLRKNITLTIISSAAMISGLAANIQNPAVEDMTSALSASSSEFSLSISLFILLQGVIPLIWSSISELRGRKVVYLFSLALFTAGSIVVALSKSIQMVIGFRCLQAAGSSAVASIGAATLADIFDPSERGKKMGIYYIAPMMGPAIGPILGGVLDTAFGWRAIFWFLSISAGLSFLSFAIFFRDTYRRERSMVYQCILRKQMTGQMLQPAADKGCSKVLGVPVDEEKQAKPVLTEACTPEIKVTLKDVNPFTPIGKILRRKNNLPILVASGIFYAFGFFLSYASARTLSMTYHYNALKIGLVGLAYGAGAISGSISGGYWSDRLVRRMKAANGGKFYAEMRLRSALIGACFLPPFTVALGWVCEKSVHISVLCIMQFACGFFSIWTYTTTVAYIVDANNGRSSTAVATNSVFRGTFAFAATELAVPLQSHLGNGWMFTIWAGIMAFCGLLILLVVQFGCKWRETTEASEND